MLDDEYSPITYSEDEGFEGGSSCSIDEDVYYPEFK